jgi:hypothetical protein
VSDVPPSRARAILETYARPLLLLVVPIAVFTIARLVLLLRYPEAFAALRAGEKAAAFLQGLRYDVSILSPVLGLPMLMLLLPFPLCRGRRWQQLWGWIGFALFAASFLVLSADVVYFGYVQRHAGIETVALGETAKAVTSSALTSHLPALLLFGAVTAALGWGWKRILALGVPPPIHFGAQIAVALGVVFLMYYGERGTLSGKRLRMVTAFQRLPEPAAHLSLNGPYCVLHSLVHARPVKTEFYPGPDALRGAQETLFDPAEAAPDPDYPLLRNSPARPAGRPNVVVIMLESWDAFAVDAQRHEMGLPPLGVTPCYDEISREGLLFTRFYANGQRSMDGMSAILCGFPTLPGTSYLGRGLEQSTLTSLGMLGRREGYDTWFIQSSERDSFRCDAIAPRLGFDHYLGAEDIPPDPPAAPRGALRGACWDHEMLAEAARKLPTSKGPFLAFLYTNSTHPPFYWPEERWKKRSGERPEDRYINSLAYADWALGRFFETAKASGWFQKTIFIVTSDHLGGRSGGATNGDPASKHHVPCFVIAPGLKPGVERRIGSQLDVIPTVADLAGWASPQAALGSSLFRNPTPGRGALCVEGNLVIRLEDGGFVVHDLSGRISAKGDADAIERRLLSVVQVAYTLMRTNRIAR